MTDYEEGVTRQHKGALASREKQELRYMLELHRARKRLWRTLRRWAGWVGASAAGAVTLAQMPAVIERVMKFFTGGGQ